MRSADGVHGVEIKKFKVKKEIPRGAAPVMIEFTADRGRTLPHRLLGVSAETVMTT